MKKSIYWIIPLLMMFGLGLYGCADSLREGKGEMPSDEINSQSSDDGEWITCTIGFSASDMITPSLRSLSEADENDIKGKVRVLVFDRNGTFDYEAPVLSVTPTTEKKDKGKVTLLLKHTGVEQYKFVMLANLPKSTPMVHPVHGQSKYDDVMSQITYTMPEYDRWKGGHLPMWGEITAVVNHNKYANPQIGTIKLIRSVARIDVGLNLTNSSDDGASPLNEKSKGLGKIKLTSVKFFNMNSMGTVAPASINLEENSVTKVKAPTILSTFKPLEKPILRIDSHEQPNIIIRDVYVPEALNAPATATQENGETLPENATNYMKRPYMVVELVGADKDNVSHIYYYRIDFLKKTGDEATASYEFLPLLRNHRYLVNILNVTGPGFETEDEAKKGPAANIMYNVVVWDESEMTNVQYDGQYMLGVSEDHFTFYREGGKIAIKAQTSWPEGLVVANLPNWVYHEIKDNDQDKTGEKTIIFEVKDRTDAYRSKPKNPEEPLNANNAAYIQAGRMRWYLHFEQKEYQKVDLKIYEDKECTKQIDFIEINQYGKGYKVNVAGKHITKDGKSLTAEEAKAKATFYVKTEPQNIQPEFNPDAANKFDVKYVTSHPNGVWEYEVTAPDITDEEAENGLYKDPFDNFNSSFKFTVKYDPTNQSASDEITFLQKEYNAIPFYDETLLETLFENEDDHIYIMDAQDKNYYVKANAAYHIRLTDAQADNGEGEMIKSFSPVDENTPALSGKQITFTPVDDIRKPKLFYGKATFEISSPTGRFATKKFKVTLVSAIKQPEANTYMIKAGAKQGILIPVSRVNTAYEYYKSLLDKDTKYFEGDKDSKKLPGSKSDFMLNKLDDDDDYFVDIIWTDIHNSPNQNLVELAGLRQLRRIGSGNSSYIYVKAGSKIGNVLIAIRSNKIHRHPILWSWHLWIVDDYPEVINIDNAKGSVKVLPRLIGADTEPVESPDYNVNSFGMQYQWGRKDPFPALGVLQREEKRFYDGNGLLFDFRLYQKGDRQNKGLDSAFEAVGGTYTMRNSIEAPYSIVSHQSFWQLELFPFRFPSYFNDRYVFRYPWNRYREEIDHIYGPGKNNDKLEGGKTVFDPSPYGFRIMNYRESYVIEEGYKKSTLKLPLPGFIYDGSFNSSGSGNRNALYAISQANGKAHAGYYYVIKPPVVGLSVYRRGCTFSVIPVEDSENFGDNNKNDYKNYLPK